MHLFRPACEHQFADHVASFDLGMSSSKIGRMNWRKRFSQRGLDHLCINPSRDLCQKFVLLNHIFRLIHRAGKHELPNKCGTLSLECVQIYRFGGVNDSANTAQRLNGFAHGLPMLVGLEVLKI